MMSAIEWFTFISLFVWGLQILNAFCLIPLKHNHTLGLRSKITLVLCGVSLLGWIIALLSTHITTPTLRVNLLQLSQLLLTPSLIGLTVTLLLHLLRGNNLLVILLRHLKKAIQPCLRLLIRALPFIPKIAAAAVGIDEQEEEFKRKLEREEQEKIHINWQGEYSGEDDSMKY